MLRKLMCGAVAAVALMTPAAFAGHTSGASRVTSTVGHHRHYHVYYRDDCCCPWRLYRTFDCHERAHAVADRLQCRGVEAKVVHH